MDKKVTMGSEQGALSLIGEIKRDIISTQRKILIDANRELILLYFPIGKVISENQKYGSNFINLLSASLKPISQMPKAFRLETSLG